MNAKDTTNHGPTVVYVDSSNEQEAWLIATFGPPETWEMRSQTWALGEDGERREVFEVALGNGEQVQVAFAEATADESLEGEGRDRTREMDDLMEQALAFAAENPPHHPGSLPRFPVPSPSYKDAIAVPLAVLAVDDTGQRGVYAPPRQAAIRRSDGTLVGVGEYPGFDPEHWPPPHLGPWPPPQLNGIPAVQLQAMIQRFSACWSRILDAWFDGVVGVSPVLKADVREALHRRATLDLMEMLPFYERLNPVFAKWLNGVLGPDVHAEETT